MEAFEAQGFSLGAGLIGSGPLGPESAGTFFKNAPQLGNSCFPKPPISSDNQQLILNNRRWDRLLSITALRILGSETDYEI